MTKVSRSVTMAGMRITGGKYRGMPNLGLTESDIEKLVAYLLTLK